MPNNDQSKEHVFFFFMIVAMLFWGGSWISGKLASSTASAEILVFWRFSISCISFIPLCVYLLCKKTSGMKTRHSRTPAETAVSLIWTLLSAFILAAYNFLFFNGLKTGLAGKGSLIVTSMNPVFALIIARLVLGEKIRPVQTCGLLLGVAGATVLIEPWRYSIDELITGGNLLFLAAALLWACLTIASFKGQRSLHPFVYNIALYGTAALIIFMMYSHSIITGTAGLPLPFWMNTLYLALLAGTLGSGLYFLAVKRIGAGRTGSFTFLVPGCAVLLAWLLLKEVPSISTLVGGVMTGIAVWLINKKNRTAPEPEAPVQR